MKISQMKHAIGLADELARLKEMLAMANEAETRFTLSMKRPKSHSPQAVGHVDGVALNGTGSYGMLAASLKDAAVKYFEYLIQIHEQELKQMDAEL